MNQNRPYKGAALKGQKLISAQKELKKASKEIEAYLPDEGLVEAVNLAIFLNKPLLIKGEPGCGKTRLARAVAWELYGKNYGAEYDKFYFEWHIKSTSKAREGFYHYDHLARLRDHHLNLKQDKSPSNPPHPPHPPHPAAYVKLGEIGKAFLEKLEERPIILIDEIDKADIDFPNDLLRELDRYEFTIEELAETDFQSSYETLEGIEINYINHADKSRLPIIIITSNDEKELPEAFLRRCVFYYIDFPDKIEEGEDRLKTIVNSHFQESSLTDEEIEKAIERFRKLRVLIQNAPEQNKNVTTSELIDWFKVLEKFSPDEKILAKLKGRLPYASVLLKGIKAHEDWLMAVEDNGKS